MNYIVIVEIKKIVPWEECVILRKWSKDERVYIESKLEIGNRSSTIIDTLFPTLYSGTKQPYQGDLGV